MRREGKNEFVSQYECYTTSPGYFIGGGLYCGDLFAYAFQKKNYCRKMAREQATPQGPVSKAGVR